MSGEIHFSTQHAAYNNVGCFDSIINGMSARNHTATIGINAINGGILKRIFSRPLALFNDRFIINYGRVYAIFFNSRVGPVDFSYITEIFPQNVLNQGEACEVWPSK